MPKTVIVTGGAGYIGSHACKLLAHRGYVPVTIDNFSRGNRWAVKWGPLVEGDVRDPCLLEEAFKKYAPAAVMHFASFTYVGESVEKPELYYRNNLFGAIELLDAMKSSGCGILVFSSSAAVYGIPDSVPIREDHRENPINPYGRTKSMIENMIRDCAGPMNLKYALLRYFNAAGADKDCEIGESHDPETHLIPLVIHAAMGRIPELKVFGGDYPTPDGSAIRDYVHVEDLAEAHVAAIEKIEAGMPSVSINLGTGSGSSVFEVIEAVEKISGKKVPRKVSGRRAGDPPSLVANNEKARELLGWTRKHSLESIVRTAWNWHSGGEDRRLEA